MKIFSYNDYIKCIHTIRLNAILQVAEEKETYHLEKNKKKETQDKLVKNILRDEEEAKKFINYFLKPKKPIKSEELIKYSSNYITKKYKSKKADLIYKLKGHQIFFLIENLSEIDYSISYKMLNYCVDIMQECTKNKYSIVVPILIYTGNEKWKYQQNLEDMQLSNYILKRNKIEMEYNLIEINKISKQTLLEQNTIFGKAMVIEKSKNKEELINNLELIIKTTKQKEQLNKLANLINYIQENKGGECSMSTLYDRIIDENRRLIKKKN